MKQASFFLAALLTLTAVGCGGKSGPATAEVTGEITFDGQPVAEGDITFLPADGQGHPYAGKIVAGKYSLKCEPGKKRVEITAFRPVPGKFNEDNPGEKTPVIEQYIPPEYNAQSKLEADVSASGPNAFPFELKALGG